MCLDNIRQCARSHVAQNPAFNEKVVTVNKSMIIKRFGYE